MARPPKSVRSFANTIWRTVVSPCIRLRDCLKTTGTTEWGDCYTCGKRLPYADLEAGHWKAASKNGTRFKEDNLRIQCSVCNDYRKGNGMRNVYEANLRKEIGNERVDRIVIQSHIPTKFTFEDLEIIRNYYKKRMEELKRRIKK